MNQLRNTYVHQAFLISSLQNIQNTLWKYMLLYSYLSPSFYHLKLISFIFEIIIISLPLLFSLSKLTCIILFSLLYSWPFFFNTHIFLNTEAQADVCTMLLLYVFKANYLTLGNQQVFSSLGSTISPVLSIVSCLKLLLWC